MRLSQGWGYLFPCSPVPPPKKMFPYVPCSPILVCSHFPLKIWPFFPYHETQIGQVEKVQRTAARWTCRRWRNTSSVGDMLDDLEWPSLETRREQSSLTFFYKIHSGTVDLDKDKYLTPAPNLRRTRASHESQYTRYFAYSDALKNYFSPGLSLCGILFPLQWSHLRPLRSLRLRFRLLVQRYVF